MQRVMSMTSGTLSSYAQTRSISSYAEDRAAIEDIQARYLFALDFHDPDLYVSTFTEDGVLDYGSGLVKGRDAIKDVIARMPNPAATAGLRPAAARHNISNIVIKVDGDKITFGQPFLKGASLTAEVVEHLRGPKLKIFKFKRRREYRRRKGHRDELTRIRVSAIKA